MARLFSLVFLLTFFQAQAQQQRFSIYFDSDSFKLTNKHKNELKSFVSELAHRPFAYAITLTGHTDSSASFEYNQRLSQNRVNSATAFLNQLGFLEENLNANAFSFSAPNTHNLTEKAKRLNRRVELEFELISFQIPKALSMQQNKEVFRVNVQQDATLNYNGSQIQIPSNAFVDKDGLLVKGEIDVDYAEYRNPLDFINSQVPMSVPLGDSLAHFHSSGMFSIKAQQNGNKLELANGKKIAMQFKVENIESGTNFYRFDEEKEEWVELYNFQNQNQLESSNHLQLKLSDSQSISCQDSCKQLVYATFNARNYLKNKTPIAPILAVKRENFPDLTDSYNQLALASREITRLEDGVIKEVQKELEKKTAYLHIYPSKRKRGQQVYMQMDLLNRFSSREQSTSRYRGIPNTKNAYRLYYLKFKNKRDRRATCKAVRGQMFDSFYVNEIIPGRAYELTLKNPEGEITKISFDGFIRKPGKRYVFAHKAYKAMDDLNATNDLINSKTQALKKDLAMLNSNLDSFSLVRAYHKNLVDSISAIDAQIDALQCLYNFNKQFAKAKELAMGVSDWGKYFDSNHWLMTERYDSIAKANQFSDCYMKENAILTSLSRKNRQRNTQASVLGLGNVKASAIQELKINRLGMYNADAVKKLSAPRKIRPVYTAATGHEISVAKVHLIDKKINGIITYDGYMNCSPYKLVYSTTMSTQLIVVDVFGKAYLYDIKFNKLNSKGRTPNIVLGEALPENGVNLAVDALVNTN